MPRGASVPIMHNGIKYKSITAACKACGVLPTHVVRYRDRWRLTDQEAFDQYVGAREAHGLKQGRHPVPVNVDGIVYDSMADACEALGIPEGRLVYLARMHKCSRREALLIAVDFENQVNKWTDEELHLLKEHYPTRGSNIPELLGAHTQAAIRARAKREKIYRWYNNPDCAAHERVHKDWYIVRCRVCNRSYTVHASQVADFSHETHSHPIPDGWNICLNQKS